MGEDKSSHKEPDLHRVQIWIKKGERDETVDQSVGELSQETPDFELVKLLELQDEVCDEMRQNQF
jgi:hypothetical protein